MRQKNPLKALTAVALGTAVVATFFFGTLLALNYYETGVLTLRHIESDNDRAEKGFKYPAPNLDDLLRNLTSGGLGYIDQVVVENANLLFSGWSLDREGNAPSKLILLYIDGKFLSATVPTIPRPDVTKGMGSDVAGFRIVVPSGHRLPVGERKVRAFGLNSNGKFHELTFVSSSAEISALLAKWP
jgi:hypothetical protein